MSYTRYVQLGRLPDLNDPIIHLRRALELTVESDPLRPAILNLLGQVLQSKSEWEGRSGGDMLEALTCHREVLRLSAVHNSYPRQKALTQLGLTLYRQYRVTGTNEKQNPDLAIPALDDAVKALRESLNLEQNHQSYDHAICHNNLSLALRTRFIYTLKRGDLDQAIENQEIALQWVSKSHPSRASFLTNLVISLHMRFDHSSLTEDFVRAITLHYETLSLPAQRCKDQCFAFSVLEPVLRKGVQPTKQLPVLLDSDAPSVKLPPAPSPSDAMERIINFYIAVFRSALEYRIIDRAQALTALGLALRGRTILSLRRALDTSDINEAISLLNEVSTIVPHDHPYRAQCLLNLVLAEYTAYESFTMQPDASTLLELLEATLREALCCKSLAENPRLKAHIFDAIAVILHSRFKNGGKSVDLDESIIYNRKALHLRELPGWERSISLLHLGQALHSRADRMHHVKDVDEALSLYAKGLSSTNISLIDQKELYRSRASALRSRYILKKSPSDIDDSIAALVNGLSITPEGDIDRFIMINELAVTLQLRYTCSRYLGDIDTAIELHRTSLSTAIEPNENLLAVIINLAQSLLIRAGATGRLSDLNEAINICRSEGSRFINTSHHYYRENAMGCPLLETFAHALLSRFLRADDDGNQLSDCMTAMHALETIERSPSLPLFQRYSSVRLLARVSDALDDGHGYGLQVYRSTIELLPLLAGIGLTITQRQRSLVLDTDGLACEAAACAIRQKKYTNAVELLEEGRGIFWAQALQLRTPLDDLEEVHPVLAQELRDISRTLEDGALRDLQLQREDGTEEDRTILDQDSAHYSRLDASRVELLDQIRDLDGFRDFLQPKPFHYLLASASNGPVIILNASKFRSECDALILRPGHDTPYHIPFRTFTYRRAYILMKRMRELSQSSLPAFRGGTSRGTSIWMPEGGSDAVFRKVLGSLWREVVLPVIGLLGLKVSIIYCCPISLIANIPP